MCWVVGRNLFETLNEQGHLRLNSISKIWEKVLVFIVRFWQGKFRVSDHGVKLDSIRVCLSHLSNHFLKYDQTELNLDFVARVKNLRDYLEKIQILRWLLAENQGHYCYLANSDNQKHLAAPDQAADCEFRIIIGVKRMKVEEFTTYLPPFGAKMLDVVQ